ncbi:MAG: putative sugar O-methyltransferase [Xanthobacteraceae bacterium]|nr:putative sugar O-methyltransferase [Xanthobacteraceae bacterium]
MKITTSIQNRYNKLKLKRGSLLSARGSSASDFEPYLAACRNAATTDGFNSFRKNFEYRRILEHVSIEDGRELLDIASKRFPEYPWNEFRRNDEFGGAETVEYGRLGNFTPTTNRYIKILSDIELLFGDLNGKRIVEIGGGYGGQARIIHARFTPKSYTIVDLPDPAALTRRYLDCFGLSNITVTSRISKPDMAPDLVISNYALSEIRRKIQNEYLNAYALQSKHGYMIWNVKALTKGRLWRYHHPMSDRELRKRVGGTIISTSPWLTSEDLAIGNSLVVWGTKAAM